MKKRYAGLVLATCLSLVAGCAPQNCRMVEALDGGQFVAMSRAMRPVMLKKNMVDQNGDWYSPMFSSRPVDAGKTLVDRLAPAFRFPGSKLAVAPTFRAMLTPDAKVKIEDNRAVIEQGMSRVTLELVAVTDWNNDGVDDWLVNCRVGYTDTPQRFREYYLVIIDLTTPVLKPYVLMVLDHVYNRVTVRNDASGGELAETNVMEFMQGQSIMTEAADSRTVHRKLEEGSSLKQTSLSH
ncbi:hypothetical protein [uncultured Mailhella sp.]|uniref:hypothetical protein n=1 Tax=uncultured Mailhella sp. TaxID=1981031 RepID=UPI0025DAF2C9|nr:hypothetical protein [uncultured Mailhella sp.]